MAGTRWEIYFLRHADAGDLKAWRGDDDARPLSAKGVGQAERLGTFLASVGFAPDAILSSPKLRATQTAELIGSQLNQPVTTNDALAGSFTIDGLPSLLSTIEHGSD